MDSQIKAVHGASSMKRYQQGVLIFVSTTMLTVIFLFQGFNYTNFLFGEDAARSAVFVFNMNKTIRFLLNDAFAVLLIYALFREKKYVWFAFAVQAVGTLCILIPYLLIKTQYPGYNGPLISFLHRLVVNPLLLLILIPAFLYQKGITRPSS